MKDSRRQFITTAAVAALAGSAAGIGALADETRALADRRAAKVTETDYDVIVIGGGFSGVVAARDCQKAGLKPLLLEARDRLGGRTLDTTWNGHHIELGGTWLHWNQPYTWSELNRYGLEIVETPGADSERLIARGPDFNLDTVFDRVVDEIRDAGDRYFVDAHQVWERPWDAHFTWNKLRALDALTTRDRMQQTKLSALQRTVLTATAEACTHSRLERGSYLEVARWYALNSWSWTMFSDTLARYQIAQGSGELIRRIVADGKFPVRLASPVRRLTQREGATIVHTSAGVSYAARAVILAVPMNCLASIECEPALSSNKLAAAHQRHTGAGIKFFADLKGRHGKTTMLAPTGYGLGYAFTYAEGADSTLFVGFGSDPSLFDPNDEEAMQRVFRQFIPDAQISSCTSYAWIEDPYSLGTYCSYPPGQLTRWLDELRRQEGAIYMAGSDIAEGWRGFIDGAIATGARAAAQVAMDLNS